MFDVGDRIEAGDTGAKATVERIKFTYSGSGHTRKADVEYYVRWDHFPAQTSSYMATDVDNIWKKIQDNNIILPQGISVAGMYDSGYEDRDWEGNYIKKPCDHEWVLSGFHFLKTICKKCDIEKPEEKK